MTAEFIGESKPYYEDLETLTRYTEVRGGDGSPLGELENPLSTSAAGARIV